jgi:hypothetical protein
MQRMNHDTGTIEKRCSTCKGWYPLKRFAKDRTRKEGLYPRCKMCDKDRKDLRRERQRAVKCLQLY